MVENRKTIGEQTILVTCMTTLSVKEGMLPGGSGYEESTYQGLQSVARAPVSEQVPTP